jgi:hypothetical protein
MFSIHYVYSFTKINKLEKKIIFRLNNLVAFLSTLLWDGYGCLIPVYGCLVHMYNIPALYMCYSNVCLYVHVYMILSLFMNKCVPSWLVKIWYISQICNGTIPKLAFPYLGLFWKKSFISLLKFTLLLTFCFAKIIIRWWYSSPLSFLHLWMGVRCIQQMTCTPYWITVPTLKTLVM